MLFAFIDVTFLSLWMPLSNSCIFVAAEKEPVSFSDWFVHIILQMCYSIFEQVTTNKTLIIDNCIIQKDLGNATLNSSCLKFTWVEISRPIIIFFFQNRQIFVDFFFYLWFNKNLWFKYWLKWELQVTFQETLSAFFIGHFHSSTKTVRNILCKYIYKNFLLTFQEIIVP